MTLAVWIDGRVLEDPHQPVLRADDRGFLLGDAVFETIRVRGGEPRHRERHESRLRTACDTLGIPTAGLPTPHDLAALIARVAEDDGVLRITVSRGPGGRGLVPAAADPTVVASYSRPPPPAGGDGIPAFLARPWWDRRSPVAGLKTCDRAGAIVQARPGGEGLVVDGEELRCGLASNVFLVVGGVLATPLATEGVRAGVAREVLLSRLAPELGIEAEERPLSLSDLASASELLFTNAVHGIRAATELEGHVPAYGEPRVGRLLQAAWLG
jgi:branched-chain amino acid aminotransferase